MKKSLALLLALMLSLTFTFASAEETPKKLRTPSSRIADLIISAIGNAKEKAEEVKQNVAEKAQEVKQNVTEKAQEAAEKAEEIKQDASEKAQEIKEKVSKEAEEAAQKASEKAQEIKEKVTKEAEEAAKKASEKAQEIKETVKEKTGTIREAISGVLDALPGAWEQAKETAKEKADEAKQYVSDGVQRLMDWLNNQFGGDPTAPEGEETLASPRREYLDGVYFGMSMSEFTNNGHGYPVFDKDNGVYVSFVEMIQPDTGIYAILFRDMGDGSDPVLSEIMGVVYGRADEVKLDDAGNIEIISTTDDTVKAVYDQIESALAGSETIELGEELRFALYAGMKLPESAVSQAKLHLCQDGNGWDAATHYVAVGEKSFNVVHYLYLDAAAYNALTAK